MMPASRIRTLIVDDSALMRAVLADVLGRAADIEVVGEAYDTRVARHKIKELNPNVLTLDVEMPGMDGLSFLGKLMALRPMPVVMVSSYTQAGTEVTLNALDLGAVDFLGKPIGDLAGSLEVFSEELIDKVRAAARARVGLRCRLEGGGQRAQIGVGAHVSPSDCLVAVGCSAGGPEALKCLISAFPAGGPAMVVAQHMPAGFTARFAARLNACCAMNVKEAEDGDLIEAGSVYLAPGGRHLAVRRSGADLFCSITDAEPVNRHKPSVDVLFASVAAVCGSRAVGVILTGMGKDGVAGLKAMRAAGAATLGQDEETSLVYGMPRCAFEAGAVQRQLGLNALPRAINKQVLNHIGPARN